LPSLLLSEDAKADGEDEGATRSARSYQIRVAAAAAERNIPTPRQLSAHPANRL